MNYFWFSKAKADRLLSRGKALPMVEIQGRQYAYTDITKHPYPPTKYTDYRLVTQGHGLVE